jgi:lactate permease
LFFETSPEVAFWAALDGITTTLPLLLVILSGIFLSSLLTDSGSLVRIVKWFKEGAGNSLNRNLLITFGVGNFMEGTGVIAEPVVAPMLRAAGVSSLGSAALSIIGYAGLMTLEMAGIVIIILSLVTGLPVQELGLASAWISLPAVILMALSAPMFLPNSGSRAKAYFQCLLTGCLLGASALATVIWLGVAISGTLAGLVVILVLICMGSGRVELNSSILKDLAPFGFLILCLFSVNSIPFLRELTFERLSLKLNIIPVHAITFRPLFSAYVYIFLACFMAIGLQGIKREKLKAICVVTLAKGWRACLAMGLFGAMGQVISYSGYLPGFSGLDQAHNIPFIISHGLIRASGGFYPVFVPFLGWVGTFLTGYGVASIMLFGQLQVQAAPLLGVSPALLAGALAVGTALGSISSPFKIALATPMVGAMGREGEILRVTIPLGILASLLVGVVVWLFA